MLLLGTKRDRKWKKVKTLIYGGLAMDPINFRRSQIKVKSYVIYTTKEVPGITDDKTLNI